MLSANFTKFQEFARKADPVLKGAFPGRKENRATPATDAPAKPSEMGDISFGLKDWFKGSGSSLKNTNFVFVLHYKITFMIFLASAAFVYANKTLSTWISCKISESGEFGEKFCWANGLYYVIDNTWGRYGKEVAIPLSYQLTGVFLLSQAILYIVPGYLWKWYESGQLDAMKMYLHEFKPDNEKDDERMDYMICKAVENYFFRFRNRNKYFYMYLFCELLSLGIIGISFYTISHICEMNYFVYGFQLLGYEWPFVLLKRMKLDTWVWDTHMDDKYYHRFPDRMITASNSKIMQLPNVFPTMARCVFTSRGPTNDVQRGDGLCVLPINVLNERIYICLWFWLAFLTICTILVIMYHLLMSLPIVTIRACFLRVRTPFKYSWHRCNVIASSAGIGDLFILMKLQPCLMDFIYNEYLDMVCRKIRNTYHV